jgi:NAD(P)-dependent dehydrogenase (short-subunit alcohol dehydrogenase family)
VNQQGRCKATYCKSEGRDESLKQSAATVDSNATNCRSEVQRNDDQHRHDGMARRRGGEDASGGDIRHAFGGFMSPIVWFITGASRGFGLEIARAALERGDAVVAAARDPQAVIAALGEHEQLLAVALDVTVAAQAEAAVAAALTQFGQIDVLVNNAGRGLLGAIEETSEEEVRAVFAVNVDGLLTVTRAVLPSMRARRSGRIVNLSSVGGFAAWPGWGVYCATKFAVEGLSEALHAELLPFGVRVTIIEPGPFRTDFLDSSSLQRAAHTIEEYAASVGATREWADGTNHAQAGDPVKAAAAIIKVATSAEPPLRLQLGADCVARVEAKLAEVATELSAWREVALSTEYEVATAMDATPHGAGN